MTDASTFRKTVLILGAGTYQVPLIKTAKRLGHRVLVVSTPGNYPGIDLADEFYPLDTTDVEAVCKLAREMAVDAVLTAGTDIAVPTIGKCVDVLGLAGTGYEAAVKSSDKALMKQAFTEHDVPTAEFSLVSTLEQARKASKTIGYPVMVKATCSSGSRGVSRVDSIYELESAWIGALGESRSNSPEVIIERCLEGVEFGAQAVVCDDKVIDVFSHNDSVTPPPKCTPVGHSVPFNLGAEVEKKTRKAVEAAVRALGLRDTVANIDLILVDNNPFIIEAGARIGATCIPEMLGYSLGVDMYEFLVNLALGEEPELLVGSEQAIAALLLNSGESGTVKEVVVPEFLEKHPNVLEISIDVEPGDKVVRFETGPDRVGHVIARGGSASEAEKLAVDLAGHVLFTLEVQ